MLDCRHVSSHMPVLPSATIEIAQFLEKTSKVPYQVRFWRKWQGEEFPFRCGVYFIPQDTKQLGISRPSPPVIFGIVVGYTYAPGYMFGKQYKFFSIDDFVGKSLDIDTQASAFPNFWGRDIVPTEGGVWQNQLYARRTE